MRHKTLAFAFVAAAGLATPTSLAGGLSSDAYAIDPLDVNGGGTRSTGGVYALTASTAQAGGVGVIWAGTRYEFTDGFLGALANTVHLTGSQPGDQKSLSRSQKNIVRLTFDGDIGAPQAGAVLIQEMLNGGAYGPDVSSEFTFAVENDQDGNPRILSIREKASALTNRRWYAIRNAGGWPDVSDFVLHYVVQVGDANNDGKVLNSDIGAINAAIPTLRAADHDPRDINGDGRILNRDVGLANGNIPSLPVPKPTGH